VAREGGAEVTEGEGRCLVMAGQLSARWGTVTPQALRGRVGVVQEHLAQLTNRISWKLKHKLMHNLLQLHGVRIRCVWTC